MFNQNSKSQLDPVLTSTQNQHSICLDDARTSERFALFCMKISLKYHRANLAFRLSKLFGKYFSLPDDIRLM